MGELNLCHFIAIAYNQTYYNNLKWTYQKRIKKINNKRKKKIVNNKMKDKKKVKIENVLNHPQLLRNSSL